MFYESFKRLAEVFYCRLHDLVMIYLIRMLDLAVYLLYLSHVINANTFSQLSCDSR